MTRSCVPPDGPCRLHPLFIHPPQRPPPPLPPHMTSIDNIKAHKRYGNGQMTADRGCTTLPPPAVYAGCTTRYPASLCGTAPAGLEHRCAVALPVVERTHDAHGTVRAADVLACGRLSRCCQTTANRRRLMALLPPNTQGRLSTTVLVQEMRTKPSEDKQNASEHESSLQIICFKAEDGGCGATDSSCKLDGENSRQKPAASPYLSPIPAKILLKAT